MLSVLVEDRSGDIDSLLAAVRTVAADTASRRCNSASYSRAFSISIAIARLRCWLRSVWHATMMPDGTCVMRIALSVLLTCCPPAPEER